MRPLNSIFILIVAYFSVFLSAWLEWPRLIFGASIVLLPALLVYVGMTQGLIAITLASLGSGLCFDAMSANPLGVSVLPLFLIGFVIHLCRELLPRADLFAQSVLGAAAGGFYPLMTLFLICNVSIVPLLGWRTIWHVLFAMVIGGLAAPALFWLFDQLDLALNYRPRYETSFRADREIKRGRA